MPRSTAPVRRARPLRAPGRDVSTDALLEGDLPFEPGSARSALRHRTFRTVFFGAFASNIGSWMQMVVLGAFAYDLTNSSSYVAALVFAQMGPTILLALVGGLIADLFDRRRLLIGLTIQQLVFSLVLAVIARDPDPSQTGIFFAVLAIGIGGALFMPAYSAILPGLVGRRDLPGAISLNSAQMNASRVIGPAIGGIAYAAVGPAWVFAGNAVTYLFVIAALLKVTLPAVPHSEEDRGIRRLTLGFRVARRDRVVGQSLTTIAVFSFFCIIFVGQMPVLAAENLGLDTKSGAYGVLYACFGLGAVIGSLAIGTVLAHHSKGTLVRYGLTSFAVSVAVFALLRDPRPAYVVAAIVGLVYFGTVTCLNTAMQSRLADHERGRVMALWMMGFGGMVSLGNLAAGPIIDATSITLVMLVGCGVALGLARFVRFEG